MKPCLMAGPEIVAHKSAQSWKRTPVSCNRPAGHPGHHQAATDDGALIAEWDTAGVVVRGSRVASATPLTRRKGVK